MTANELRAWQAHMGFTYDSAAVALGISRSAYANLVSGINRSTGQPQAVDRRTALACAALARGLEPWQSGTVDTRSD